MSLCLNETGSAARFPGYCHNNSSHELLLASLFPWYDCHRDTASVYSPCGIVVSVPSYHNQN